MYNFDTTVVQKMDKSCSISEQVVVQKLVTINKHKNKHIINPFKRTCSKNEQVVLAYFKSEQRSTVEAKKFFNFYESIDWKLNGRNPIIDWKACARNWMIKADEMKNNQKLNEPSHNRDNLRTSTNKDYGEPL